jgi:hypothetical protein
MSATGAERGLERRSERRIVVHLPIQVRGTDREGVRFEETTQSENLCRSGAAFAIQRELDLGADIDITIPLPKQSSESETDFATRGRVVHIAPGRQPRERIVGVQFVGPRFHRIFVPESTA